jgi:hypothetical protein
MKMVMMTAVILCALPGFAAGEESKPWGTMVEAIEIETGPPPPIEPLRAEDVRDQAAHGPDSRAVFIFGTTLPEVAVTVTWRAAR